MSLPYEITLGAVKKEEKEETETVDVDWWFLGLFIVNIVALIIAIIGLGFAWWNGKLTFWDPKEPMDYYPEAPGLKKPTKAKSLSRSPSRSSQQSRQSPRQTPIVEEADSVKTALDDDGFSDEE